MEPEKKKKTKVKEPSHENEALGMLKDVLSFDRKEGESAGLGFSSFSKADYWDQRYAKSEKPYDWYGRWPVFRHILEPVLKKTGPVLNVGCGNSLLAEELHENGYTDVTNVDISGTVIKQMAERHAALGQKFIQMDMTQMTFADNSFDAVIDKGTFDALYTGSESLPTVKHGVQEIERILRPDGKFVSITFGDVTRRRELNSSDWGKFETHEFKTGAPNPHYVHIMTKKS